MNYLIFLILILEDILAFQLNYISDPKALCLDGSPSVIRLTYKKSHTIKHKDMEQEPKSIFCTFKEDRNIIYYFLSRIGG